MNLPFGQYKGASISRVYVTNPQYLYWLSDQPWMVDKFPGLLAAIRELFRDASLDEVDGLPISAYRWMIQVCHPDKHENSPEATRVTAWLIDRKRLAVVAGSQD